MAHARVVWMIAGGAALLRLWLAALVPLTDTTEARFGEMARKMVESGDWLVPMHDIGVPYLAKPPLAFWFSAVGIELFGAGELGPRILILAATVVFALWLYRHMRRVVSVDAAQALLLMLATSWLFFVAAAAVMTDMLLTIAVTVALAAFWERRHGGGVGTEIALYAALGLGLLVKGPLVGVLVMGPIVLWAVSFRRVREVWEGLSWLKGAGAALAIALPWYVLAELRNPGFLDYFIVGEHLSRFLVPGWDGDLYGKAHDVPRGTVLLFFVIGFLPWSIALGAALWRERAGVAARWRTQRELVAFWGIAAATPLALFSLAGNVIFPYALPAIPAAAIGFAALLEGRLRFARTAAIALVALAGAAVIALPTFEAHSQRRVVREAAALDAGGDAPLYYWQQRYFSADYYGAGRPAVLRDESALERALDAGTPFTLVVATRHLDTVPARQRGRLREVAVVGPMSLLAPVGTRPGS